VYNGLSYEEIQLKLKKSDLGKQAHAFVITDTEEYKIELEFMELGAADWYEGKYVTLKFIDAYKDNDVINIGTVGIIGTMDCSVSGELVGPKAFELGVFKGDISDIEKMNKEVKKDNLGSFAGWPYDLDGG